jgi:hypothetical protein
LKILKTQKLSQKKPNTKIPKIDKLCLEASNKNMKNKIPKVKIPKIDMKLDLSFMKGLEINLNLGCFASCFSE